MSAPGPLRTSLLMILRRRMMAVSTHAVWNSPQHNLNPQSPTHSANATNATKATVGAITIQSTLRMGAALRWTKRSVRKTTSSTAGGASGASSWTPTTLDFGA
jgi:hypothetical protein